MLAINNSIVTIDAMGCQKSITAHLIEQGANYILALKGNQPSLYHDIVNIFVQGEFLQFKKVFNKRKIEKIHDHRRTETRKYTLISAR